ncbi:XdhC family protein [Natronincola ferrireducens]|uniref:Xanthine dehydrogenase accessory factor n=1 Tax=Natronincola ferrireducens TaxID=393762 RepID=A0A1G9HCN3_9FIRM|nr:XdhC/CoxI family protein [Natronincola ferrireducens]SDL10605.1 xanthine dehydrogenase accessory factor [Natronincola ferrireducens]
MEVKLLEKITKEVKANRKVALATITRSEGSTPGREGAMMLVLEGGETYGTVGGGKAENIITTAAVKCLENCRSESFHFQLNDGIGGIQMQCGGEIDVYIKVFVPTLKLLIVGGGHIALKLYEIAATINFDTVIFEDREDYCNKDRFPKAQEIILGDIEGNLNNYDIDENCYVVIVTRGHSHDEIALKSVINTNAAYIGMIGSKNKVQNTMENLRKEGVSEEVMNKVFAPIGIDLGGNTPEEIALSILSEIILVKNKGRLLHMKEARK